MAKKIRFPLAMENGVEVRTLEELQNNFSTEKVLGYYADGKLVTWLRDRYLDDIADKLIEIDKDAPDISKKICNIFDVEYKEENIDLETIKERNRKLAILKDYTTDNKFFDVVDDIAFEQDDIYDLLDEGKITIYLCGEKFSIPLAKRGIKYVGINNPIIVVESKTEVDWKEKEITLENVKFDQRYMEIISKNESKSEEIVDLKDLFSLKEEGDIINFGSYWIESEYEKEDIEWIVLKKKGNRFLVITRYCIEAMAFDSNLSNWESSDIRTWLNNEFIQKAFEDSDKCKIDGEIFLLNEEEADTYFITNEDRQAKATRWAINKGAYIDADHNTKWWLRKPYGPKKICYVNNSGSSGYCTEVRSDGMILTLKGDNGKGSVRPAMWIEID